MASLGQVFSVDTLPAPTNNFSPVPAGVYTATITEAELKPTKSGGQRIAIKFVIEGPTHEGRGIFTGINIKNVGPNKEKVEEIARQQLGELLRATGLQGVSDTDQLIGGRCQIVVKVTPAQGEYGEGNDVKGFRPIPGGMPAAAPAPVGGVKPPWAKH